MFSVRYRKYIQSFLLILPMTGIVSGVNTIVAKGIAAVFTEAFLMRWGISLVVAFPCVLFMAPFAAKIANRLTSSE
jgi:hypothetical protein